MILEVKIIVFPIAVEACSCASRLNVKIMLKNFEERYKLESYEVIRLKFDPVDYIKNKL